MSYLGQKPQDFEIADIEKKIRLEQGEALKAKFKSQLDQSQLKKKLNELQHAPVHITYAMFLQIMTERLKVTLSDKELKAAFKLLDRDGSGSLDASEFQDFLTNLGDGDKFTEEEVEDMIKQADKDGNGTVEEDEFVAVMKGRASKLRGASKFLDTMQQEIKMYLQLTEMQKEHKRMGRSTIRMLDRAYTRYEEELKLHQGKKQILTEDMGKASFKAIYDECWDLFLLMIKREEGLEKRQKTLLKRQRELEKTQKAL